MENRFKKAIAQKQTQIGLWLGLADPYVAEIAAGAGFDWLLIDGEHAPNDLRTILSQLQAVAAYPDAHPIVRPVNGAPALLKQLLDVGCKTLLIPMVETAEQAQALVSAVRYPPHGIRGVGTALARAAGWGRDTSYLESANDDVCLLLQVETAKGLENLEAIAAVDGVDGVFIGPADLAASLGYLGQPGHPEVTRVVGKALQDVARFGKAPGILALAPDLVQVYMDFGAVFVAVGVDTVIYAHATSSLAAQYKQGLKPPPATGAGY